MAGPTDRPVALIALGGYGRRHLCPYSDIDLLILFGGAVGEAEERFLRRFLHPLWDAGLVVGHQVRERDELAELEVDNAEFLLALADTRLVAGEPALFADVRRAFQAPKTHAFVFASLLELTDARHAQFTHSRTVFSTDWGVCNVENVLLSPHAAWYSPASLAELPVQAARQVVGFLAGRPVPAIVNPGYLEHARVFCFHNGAEPVYLLASADWMQRNFDRRVEIAFPVLEPALQNRLKEILETQLADNVKGWWMQSDGNYSRARTTDGLQLRSQDQLYHVVASST